MTKKAISYFTAFCLMITGIFCMPVTVYADADGPETENGKITGTVITEDDLSAYPIGGIEEIKAMFPSTRNQKGYGSCWAHAAAACADFDMVKNHGKTTDFDVSELQLAYYTYHSALDMLGNLNGDINQRASGAKTHFLTMGGNSLYAMRTLAQWKGFTYEENIPYASAQTVIASGLAADNAHRNDAAKFEKGYIVDLKKDPDAAKQAILQYGAAIITYEYKVDYYNSSTNAYYNPFDNATNHASVIVGWDDTYPASHFAYPVSRDGAWLVRNSKTTKNTASNLGYFWMSYEDASLAEKAYVMDFMPADRYHHNYQHDGTVSTGAIKAETAANVFTARNFNAAGSETLDAVMLSFDNEAGVMYQIDIYTKLTDRKNPESGYRQSYATTIGMLQHAGVYTIPLKEKVYLAPGESFSVVVKSLNGKHDFDCELSVNRTYEDGTPRFESVAHVDPGESFYKRNLSDKSWKDCSKDSLLRYGNMCIKALTCDSSIKKYHISYELNGGKGNKNPVFYLSTTENTVLQTPGKEGYHFLGWYTESSFRTPITTINGSLGKHLKLYAKWGAHQFSIAKAKVDGKAVLRKSCKKCSHVEEYPISKLHVTRVHAKLSGDYNNIHVSWEKTPGASGYYVYYKNAKSTYSEKKKRTVKKLSTTFQNLKNGTRYTFKVVPYFQGAGSKYTSEKAKTATATTLKKIVQKAPKKASSAKVKIRWTGISGETGYQIQKMKKSGSKYKKVKSYKTTKTYIRISTAKGKTYYYKVRAYKKVGTKTIYGPWSSVKKYKG